MSLYICVCVCFFWRHLHFGLNIDKVLASISSLPPFSTHSTHTSLYDLRWCECSHYAALLWSSSLLYTQCESSSPHLSSPHLHSGPCQSYVGMGSLIEFQFSSAILFRNFSIFLHKILQWLLLWGRKGEPERGRVGKTGAAKMRYESAAMCNCKKKTHVVCPPPLHLYILYCPLYQLLSMSANSVWCLSSPIAQLQIHIWRHTDTDTDWDTDADTNTIGEERNEREDASVCYTDNPYKQISVYISSFRWG